MIRIEKQYPNHPESHYVLINQNSPDKGQIIATITPHTFLNDEDKAVLEKWLGITAVPKGSNAVTTTIGENMNDPLMNELPLTYRQLFEALKELTEEQLDSSVSILDGDECIPVYQTILFSELPESMQEDMDLDESQPLLVINKVYD